VWSSRDGDAIRTYVWTLTETEELKLQSLKIGPMTLEPYKYEEEFTGNALIITIRLEIDVATESALRDLPQYF
jgi:hypothetical protein